jgi:hypothetical protein
MKLRNIVLILVASAGLIYVLVNPNINKTLYLHISQKDHCEIDCAFGNAQATCPGNQAHCECALFEMNAYCDELEESETLSFSSSQNQLLSALAEFSRSELHEGKLAAAFDLLANSNDKDETKKRALDQCRELVSLLSDSEKNALNNFTLKESGKKLF